MKIKNYDLSRNESFLRNIYARGAFQGHGFICPPQFVGIPELLPVSLPVRMGASRNGTVAV